MNPVSHLLRGNRGQAGFTMAELAIGLVLTAILIATALTSVLNVQGSWDVSRDHADVRQNTRAAVELLVRDIRMAGSGYAGRTIATGGVPQSRLYPIQPRVVADGPDTLSVVTGTTGINTRITQPMGTPNDAVQVADVTGFTAGDLFVVTEGTSANLFKVTTVINGGNLLAHEITSPYNDPVAHVASWPSGGYRQGARVVKVERVSFWVDDQDGENARLYRRTGDDSPVPIASNVDDLVIRYVMADGSLQLNPVNPGLIRSVQIDYVGKHPDHPAEQSISIRAAPRVVG